MSSTPRIHANCPTCGVKTAEVPWAGKHSRFTLMFEAFAIEVLKACGSVKAAAELLKLDWDSVHRIMEHAVEGFFVGQWGLREFADATGRRRPIFRGLL